MPVLLFGVAGYALAAKSKWRDLALPLATVVFFVLLFSSHVTYHTYTGDGRYLTPYLALALLPATLVLEKAFRVSRRLGIIATSGFAVYAVFGAAGHDRRSGSRLR